MSAVIPIFAVVGHPNEGKSSVLSTLAEDDSVRISPVPGETFECRIFPVKIDGREILRFIDTPGFQNPRATLRWMQNYTGPAPDLVREFIRAHTNDSMYHDDCELLTPLLDETGIILVVDGSRPVRDVDRAEMEILRLIGLPRMGIINCKEDDTAYLDQWQSEFRRHFNSVRIFNSNKATYFERIALLESLKSIDQNLQGVLEMVISAFQTDWIARDQRTAEAMVAMLTKTLTYRRTAKCPEGTNEAMLRDNLLEKYDRFVVREEQKMFQLIRSFYKHNIFNFGLPKHSMLHDDLFSERTWNFLGLSKRQLVLAGLFSGAGIGAAIGLPAGGVTVGVGAAIGGGVGAGVAVLKSLGVLPSVSLLGIKLDNEKLQVGPVQNIQLLYILIDRALIFYSHTINWAHGRRDYEQSNTDAEKSKEKQGYTTNWNRTARQRCDAFFKAVQKNDADQLEETSDDLRKLLRECLASIASNSEKLRGNST